MVNSGRLSVPTAYAGSPLSTPDADTWEGGVPPGAPMLDAPLGDSFWLTRQAATGRLVLVMIGPEHQLDLPDGVDLLRVADHSQADTQSQLARRYNLHDGDACLLRPDGHIAARFRQVTAVAVALAVQRMKGFV